MRPLAPAARPSIMPPPNMLRPPVGDGGLNKQMWDGYEVVVPMPMRAPVGRPIQQVPTMEREPESFPNSTPLWVNTNCPPWICPPFWSVPFDRVFSRCVPFYEQATLLYLDGAIGIGEYVVPQDYVLIIKGFSYEALNSQQGDVFQFDFAIDGNTRMVHEDINIDAAQPNPAHRYALGGHTRQIKTHFVVDRNHSLSVRATLRGPISFSGLSPYFPGQPSTTGDCQMKIYLQGWLANLRDNVDGAPRPTDLGDADNLLMDETQSRGGYP